jgi:hypothetical protein
LAVLGVGLFLAFVAVMAATQLWDAATINQMCLRPSRFAGIACVKWQTDPAQFVLLAIFFHYVLWLSLSMAFTAFVTLAFEPKV